MCFSSGSKSVANPAPYSVADMGKAVVQTQKPTTGTSQTNTTTTPSTAPAATSDTVTSATGLNLTM